jgi:predicted ATPase
MKLLKLEVENFRHIKNQTIQFGERLTVITGQNSTGKSSLLGWIAQACDSKQKTKTLTDASFKSEYSEVFSFCKENDYSKKYSVSLVYHDTNENKEKFKKMTTRHLRKTSKGKERYKVDFDRNIKENNQRALDFPVIYLGLKRLIPLATEKDISQQNIQLTKEEVNSFSKLSKEILILLDSSISSESIKSTNKDVLAMKTSNYGHLGNSAGQDNIGQIISSMLSFKRLKKEQKEDFRGGLLLIDEIDASLYAGSQIKLIENLYKFSRDNNIQVIFTTHSLEILEHLSDRIGDETKINFLELRDGTIKNKINPSIELLRNKIKVQIGKQDHIKKKEILCEDKETELWCKNLLNGTSHKNDINILQGPFPEGTLATMAESSHPIFKEVFFVLDGDCRDKYKSKKLPPRTMILPGIHRPESIFYDFLYNLSDEDDFWDERINFTKQTCFANFQTDSHSKSVIKKWFKNTEFKASFGKGYSKLFNRWKKDNKKIVENFQHNFEKMIYK